jgi:glycogen operon protein
MRGDEGTFVKNGDADRREPDIFGHSAREPEQSINFVTCHDGFTLNDLVSYNGKHNELNGEGNRDGTNENWSWNCGAEGDSDDPLIRHCGKDRSKIFMHSPCFPSALR